MKTVPAALQTLIEKQVTTLAFCWKFTRRDGLVLRFTDHDKPLLRDENPGGAQDLYWYEALSGFTRSTLAAKGDLSVDNTDIVGLYDSDAITEEDLIKGLWDFAEYEIFLVDWTVIEGSDQIMLRRGFLGQVSLKDQQFQVEQRGLTQALAVVTGDVYSPLCRAALFDSECTLTAADWKQTSSVSSVTSRRQFIAENKKKVYKNRPFTDAEVVEVSIDADTGYATYDAQTPDGSEEHPYQITTPAELDAIRNNPAAHYVLMNNINLGSWGNWTPLEFQGTLDGRGFYIENIDLDDTTQQPNWSNRHEVGWGFFGSVGESAVVKRLGLKNVDVNPGVQSGSFCCLGAFVGICGGMIEDCWVDGGSLLTTNNGHYTGGFGGLLRRSSNYAVPPGSDQQFAAGPETRGVVRNCWSSISLSGSMAGNKGGFFGAVYNDAVAHETGCYWDSDVAGTTTLGLNCASTPLTTAQMKQAANFLEYDFVDTWVDGAGADYHRHLEPGRGNGTDEAFLRFPAVLLTAAGTYSSSIVLWSADEPGSSQIVVEASRDGDTWSSCRNGVAIPGFTPSEDLTGEYLYIRVNFVEDGSNLPILETLTWSVTGQADAFDSDALGSDGWFKAGHLKWTSGLNSGVSMEVKSWNSTTREIVLFLEMPFEIVLGDQFDIYPGCQKRVVEDCKTKFDNVANFRGEPYVPGRDAILKVPDAQR